ncbi:MAG: T9SS type A sorting domain-containing protein [Ferruginibacter sp.]
MLPIAGCRCLISGLGVRFTLPGTPAGGNGTFSYQWMMKNNCGTAGTSVQVPGATSPSFLPTDGNCYWLFVSSGGCSVPQNLVGGTTRQNVNPIVAQTATINLGSITNTQICIGGSTTLTAQSSVSYTYAWTPTGGLSPTTGGTITANPSVTTIYTVTATATDGSGCTRTAKDTVTVNPLATFSGVSANTVCTGTDATIALTGLLVNSTSTIGYQIGGGPVQFANAVISNTSGYATFITPVTFANNGQSISITSIGSSINGGPSCAQTTLSRNSTVLSVFPSSVGGTIPSVSTCSGGSGTLTLTGNTGNVLQWEISGDGGTTWAIMANTTNSAAYTVLAQNKLYRALIQSGSCTSVYSSIAITGIHNLWAGTTSSDWYIASNWADGLVPSTSCADVTIPSGTPFSPILGTGIATIINLNINAGASLTVTGATLQIAGTITSTGGLDASAGTIVFNGASSQNVSGSMFTGNNLMNLTMNNPSGVTVTTGAANQLNISGTLAFGGVSNATLHTGDNIVLTSTATGTARVADVTNNGANPGNTFDGLVSVERYFPARRAWRLFTAPISAGGPIFNNWQNNGVYQLGKGTYVSGAAAVNPKGSNGLDWTPLNNSSLKYGLALTPVVNTHTTLLSKNIADTSDNIAYFMFVRGDRDFANTSIYNYNTTTLRSRGKLQTGRQTFPASSIAEDFEFIGNPYASPVDMADIIKNNVVRRFWVWDPDLNTDQGGFVTFDDIDNDGTYTSSILPTSLTQVIQSGQAFYVQTIGAGAASVVFQETAKSSSNNLMAFRPVANKIPSVRVTLHHFLNANDSTVLLDGVLAEFASQFNKEVDLQDAIKANNIKEMLSLTRDSKNLAIERRLIPKAEDTLYLQLKRATKPAYRLKFELSNLDSKLTAFLEDGYTGTKKSLSLDTSTVIDFLITADTVSAAPDRFKIVFKQLPPIPVMHHSIKAYPLAGNIAVEWTIENEINITQYEVEKRVDGDNYMTVYTRPANGTDHSTITYNWMDVNPVSGDNFYRVRRVHFDGSAQYDSVSVKMGKIASGLSVFPNPVSNGTISMEFKNMPEGIYSVKLFNNLGETIVSKTISHLRGSSKHAFTPGPMLAAGIYQLHVAMPNNKTIITKVIFQ